MRTLDELKGLYDSELLPRLKQLEVKRKQILLRSIIIIAITLPCALVAAVLLFSLTGNRVISLTLPVLFAILIVVLILVYITRGYKYQFKEEIIRRLIAFIAPNLFYEPINCVPSELFNEASIFKHRVDRYGGEDCVTGTVGQTEIMFSEVHAEYKTTSGTGKNRSTQWHTIFKGLFFIADFNKHFKGQTVVLPDTAESLFGTFGRKLQAFTPGRDELIKLEDPEFEKHFVVYGTDQIEARYILSPALMQRITEFKLKTGTDVYLSFTGSKVYIAISLSRNLFEPSYFTCITDFTCVQAYYEDCALAIGIVDNLNLNTRIWTKA